MLPSFWTPSVTPTSNKNNTLFEIKKKTKTQPVCPVSQEDKPHYYSLRSLVTVNFTEEKQSDTNGTQRICPSCKKVLSNASKAVLAKPCGHVVCKNCVNKFIKASGHHDPHAPELDPDAVRCFVCDADLRDRNLGGKEDNDGKETIRPGLVDIRSDGTGFSAGGTNQVQKSGVAFQC